MTLHGIVRQRDKRWFVEYRYNLLNEPVQQVILWPVASVRRDGNVAFAPALVDGLEVTRLTDADAWTASHYGGHTFIVTNDEGAEVSQTPLPAPRVRSGIELRYRHGRWEKYLRNGWVAA